MRNLPKALFGWLAMTIALAMGSFVVSASATAQPAESPDAILSPAELFTLYRDHTWMWPSGGAYFSPEPRSLVAWSRSDKGDSYASGKWIITNDGQVCLKADWHSNGMVAPALNCFGHKRVGDKIYQRRLPKGKWYLFRSPRKDETQEYSNFKPGDEATTAAEGIKLSFGAADQ